jgi:putative restriction endonuclease
VEEVNFWQPGGRTRFRALRPGELFLFKLHSPRNFIVGGGVFTQEEILPISLAWQAFGIFNGATSLEDMRKRVDRYRSGYNDPGADYNIGCRIITRPFLLNEAEWLPIPGSWSRYTQQGRLYDTNTSEGRDLWERIQERARPTKSSQGLSDPPARYAEPTLIRPRLGQGAFRIAVTTAYQRRCSITQERTLPVLDAAHIRPYALGGEHEIANGLLLRQDIHTLFDLGYITIDPTKRIVVSRKIKEEFDNGKNYYAFHGTVLRVPDNPDLHPDRGTLQWHNENRYRS